MRLLGLEFCLPNAFLFRPSDEGKSIPPQDSWCFRHTSCWHSSTPIPGTSDFGHQLANPHYKHHKVTVSYNGATWKRDAKPHPSMALPWSISIMIGCPTAGNHQITALGATRRLGTSNCKIPFLDSLTLLILRQAFSPGISLFTFRH